MMKLFRNREVASGDAVQHVLAEALVDVTDERGDGR